MISCAAVLCGGEGTRLAPVTGTLPKALAPVCGRPFIFYLLDHLHSEGIRAAILCTGFGARQIKETLGPWYRDIKLIYSEEPAPLGTGGALRLALPYSNSNPLLVLNGDSYTEASLDLFQKSHARAGFPGGLLLARSENCGPFGAVKLERNGKISSFDEKSGSGDGWINAGIYLLAPSLIAQIPENKKASLEKDFFSKWARQGLLWGFSQEAPLIDIGTPETFEAAQTFFSKMVNA